MDHWSIFYGFVHKVSNLDPPSFVETVQSKEMLASLLSFPRTSAKMVPVVWSSLLIVFLASFSALVF